MLQCSYCSMLVIKFHAINTLSSSMRTRLISCGSDTVLQVRPNLPVRSWVITTVVDLALVLSDLWFWGPPPPLPPPPLGDRKAAVGIAVSGLKVKLGVGLLFLRGAVDTELIFGVVDVNRCTVLFRMRDLMVTRESVWATDGARMLLCVLESSSIQYVALVVF